VEERVTTARPLTAIRRAHLRDEVYRSVVRRVVSGELEADARLSDATLAAELGVSRTPVREALVRLEREGVLRVEPGRGFFVLPLSARRLRETAPLLAALEGLALRGSFPLPEAVLAELERLNAQIEAAADDPERGVALNLQWHGALVAASQNQRLAEIMTGLARVLRRHAWAYWRDGGHVRASAHNHAAITAALRRQDLPAALGLLEHAWTAGIEELAAWLERDGGDAG
jgi:DNA-binding GntR family transcriptional regulator